MLKEIEQSYLGRANACFPASASRLFPYLFPYFEHGHLSQVAPSRAITRLAHDKARVVRIRFIAAFHEVAAPGTDPSATQNASTLPELSQ